MEMKLCLLAFIKIVVLCVLVVPTTHGELFSGTKTLLESNGDAPLPQDHHDTMVDGAMIKAGGYRGTNFEDFTDDAVPPLDYEPVQLSSIDEKLGSPNSLFDDQLDEFSPEEFCEQLSSAEDIRADVDYNHEMLSLYRKLSFQDFDGLDSMSLEEFCEQVFSNKPKIFVDHHTRAFVKNLNRRLKKRGRGGGGGGGGGGGVAAPTGAGGGGGGKQMNQKQGKKRRHF